MGGVFIIFFFSLQESSYFRDEMVVSIATGLVSVTSRASMAVLVVGGVVRAQDQLMGAAL